MTPTRVKCKSSQGRARRFQCLWWAPPSDSFQCPTRALTRVKQWNLKEKLYFERNSYIFLYTPSCEKFFDIIVPQKNFFFIPPLSVILHVSHNKICIYYIIKYTFNFKAGLDFIVNWKNYFIQQVGLGTLTCSNFY